MRYLCIIAVVFAAMTLAAPDVEAQRFHAGASFHASWGNGYSDSHGHVGFHFSGGHHDRRYRGGHHGGHYYRPGPRHYHGRYYDGGGAGHHYYRPPDAPVYDRERGWQYYDHYSGQWYWTGPGRGGGCRY